MGDNSRDIFLYLLSVLETRSVFPKIYEGFREIDEIAKAEDYLVNIMRDCVYLLTSDKLITLMNDRKVAEFEREFGLNPDGLTIEERRDQIVSFINRSRANNDLNIYSKAVEESGIDDLEMNTDCSRLKTRMTTAANNEDSITEIENLKKMFKAISPIIPMNIDFGVGFHAVNGIEQFYRYGWTSSIRGTLGLVTSQTEPANVYGSMSKIENGSSSKVASVGTLKMPLEFKATTPESGFFGLFVK